MPEELNLAALVERMEADGVVTGIATDGSRELLC